MKTRPMIAADMPMLKAMATSSGFPYPDLSDPLIEAVYVALDDAGRPIAAVAAKRILELYLIGNSEMHPASKLHVIRILHDSMRVVLRKSGYSEVNAFLPPAIASSFGHRLERTFGWRPNWPSWMKSL